MMPSKLSTQLYTQCFFTYVNGHRNYSISGNVEFRRPTRRFLPFHPHCPNGATFWAKHTLCGARYYNKHKRTVLSSRYYNTKEYLDTPELDYFNLCEAEVRLVVVSRCLLCWAIWTEITMVSPLSNIDMPQEFFHILNSPTE